MKNILFIGGVHGAGKNFAIDKLKTQTDVVCLSAGEVLKWREISPDPDSKRVESISATQDILTENLKKIIRPEQKYILDGHFTLLNKNGDVERVPAETFEKINPCAVIIKSSAPQEILARLQKRDRRNWDLQKIIHMQNEEIAYGREIAQKLNIRCMVIDDKALPMIAEVVRTQFLKEKVAEDVLDISKAYTRN